MKIEKAILLLALHTHLASGYSCLRILKEGEKMNLVTRVPKTGR